MSVKRLVAYYHCLFYTTMIITLETWLKTSVVDTSHWMMLILRKLYTHKSKQESSNKNKKIRKGSRASKKESSKTIHSLVARTYQHLNSCWTRITLTSLMVDQNMKRGSNIMISKNIWTKPPLFQNNILHSSMWRTTMSKCHLKGHSLTIISRDHCRCITIKYRRCYRTHLHNIRITRIYLSKSMLCSLKICSNHQLVSIRSLKCQLKVVKMIR